MQRPTALPFGEVIGWQLIDSMFHQSSHCRESIESLKNHQTKLIEIATLSEACISTALWQWHPGSGGKGTEPCHP